MDKLDEKANREFEEERKAWEKKYKKDIEREANRTKKKKGKKGRKKKKKGKWFGLVIIYFLLKLKKV